MQLTTQQQAVIESNHHLVVNAVAGSGKTTTLIAYAKSRPAGSRILYLAFNASVKTEARKKFDEAGLPNVKVETAHSLAFGYVVAGTQSQVVQGYKSYELADMLGIKTGDRHVDYTMAGHVLKYMGYWCNSSVPRVQELDYLAIQKEPRARLFVNNFYDRILKHTREALAQMQRGELAITHDFYLKKFQLQSPVLPFDYILFDEGQDASAAMLDVFLKQPAIKVIVGDIHQQIYGWRFAVNSLQQVPFPVMPLSQSFRFNDEVALVANNILKWKHTCLGWPKPVKIEGSDVNTDSISTRATLGRSNLALMTRAIDNWQSRAAEKLYFEGNINSYTFADEGASLYDILNLQTGKTGAIRDKLIASMHSMKDLEEYMEKTDDNSLRVMVEVVKKYGRELPALIAGLKGQHTATKQEADMIYSTVHRCKGMEYDEVKMLDDFLTEAKLQKQMTEIPPGDAAVVFRNALSEEVNIVYVAATRTRAKLFLPEGLSPFKTVQIVAQPESAVQPNYELKGYGFAGRQGYKDWEREKLFGESLAASVRSSTRLVKPSNSGKPWSVEDDNELLSLYNKNQGMKIIAAHFGRSQTAIRKRLEYLGLDGDARDIPF